MDNYQQQMHPSQYEQQYQRTYSSNEVSQLFQNLQSNYNQRIEELQQEMSQICENLERDEVLETMKNAPDLEKMRVERFKEIIRECFKTEKENKIDQLVQENAILRLNLKRAEEDKEMSIEMAKDELGKMGKRLIEFEQKLQHEENSKIQLISEIQKLNKKSERDKSELEELVKLKESSKSQQDVLYRQQLKSTSEEFEELLKFKSNLAIENEQLKEKIAYLEKNVSMLSMKQASRSEQERAAEQKQEELKGVILKLQQQINELVKANQHSLEQLDQKQQESQTIQLALQENQKENDLLAAEIEKLRINSMKSQNNLQEGTAEINKKLEKVKAKKKILKEKVNENKKFIEKYGRDIEISKRQLADQKESYEKKILGMCNDMHKIKEEWEERCNEIDQERQHQLEECKSKYAKQLQSVSNEYELMLEKQISEYSNTSIINSKLPKTAQQLDKEYIRRDDHQRMLEDQISKIQIGNNEYIQQLEDRHKQNISNKINEIIERKNKEHESILVSLQDGYGELENKFEIQLKKDQEDKNRMLELENAYFRLKDENNGHLHHIKELSEKDNKNVLELSSLKQQLNQSQIKLTELEEQIQEQIDINQQLQEDIDQLQSDITNESEKLREAESEMTQLAEKIERLEDEKESLQRQLVQEKQRQENEKKAALRQAQFSENSKLDKEREDHDEAKMKISKLENKQKQLVGESQKLREDLSEEKAKRSSDCKRLESSIEKLESDKRQLIVNNTELKQKIELWGEKLNLQKQRIIKHVGLKLKSLKDDLSDMQRDQEDLIFKLCEFVKLKVRVMQEDIQKEKKDYKLQFEIDFKQIEESLKQQFSKKQTALAEERDSFKEKCQQLHNQLDQNNQDYLKLQDEMSRTKQNKKDQEESSNYFAAQVSRIQTEQSQLITMAVETALQAPKKEIENLRKQLQSQQSSQESSTQQFVGNEELQKLRKDNKAYQNQINLLNEEVRKKEQIVASLKEQLKKMQHLYHQMQEENTAELNKLELRLESYKNHDKSKNILEIQESNVNIEDDNQIIYHGKKINSSLEVERQSAHFKSQDDDAKQTKNNQRDKENEYWKEQIQIQKQLQQQRFGSKRNSLTQDQRAFKQSEFQTNTLTEPAQDSNFSVHQSYNSRIISSRQSPKNTQEQSNQWTLQHGQIPNYNNSNSNEYPNIQNIENQEENDDEIQWLHKRNPSMMNQDASFATAIPSNSSFSALGNQNNNNFYKTTQNSPINNKFLGGHIKANSSNNSSIKTNFHLKIENNHQIKKSFPIKQLQQVELELKQKSAALIAASSKITQRESNLNEMKSNSKGNLDQNNNHSRQVSLMSSKSVIQHLNSTPKNESKISTPTNQQFKNKAGALIQNEILEKKNFNFLKDFNTNQYSLNSQSTFNLESFRTERSPSNNNNHNQPLSNNFIQKNQNCYPQSQTRVDSEKCLAQTPSKILSKHLSSEPSLQPLYKKTKKIFENFPPHNLGTNRTSTNAPSQDTNSKAEGTLLLEIKQLLAQSYSLVGGKNSKKTIHTQPSSSSPQSEDRLHDYLIKKGAATARRVNEGKSLSQQIQFRRIHDSKNDLSEMSSIRQTSSSSYSTQKIFQSKNHIQ